MGIILRIKHWLNRGKLSLVRRRVLAQSVLFVAVLGLGVYGSKAIFVHADTYRSIVQAESTVLNYWPMDDASGSSTLTALVGGNNINLTGATTGVSGQVDGTSVSFNGTTNYGRTASTLNLSSYNKVVVEALVNLPTTDNTGRVGWELTSNTNTGTTGFLFTANEPSVTPHKMTALLKGNTGFSYGYYTIPTASQWHHVAIEYDKSLTTNEPNMYIDGVLQTATSRPNNTNNTNNFANDYLYLMSRGGTSLFGQGKMQHLAIYSSLSSARILAHANAALSSLTPGTLAETSHTTTSATLNWTAATNNSGSVTTQLQRSASGAGVWSDVSGATSSPATNTGLSTSTVYDYRVAYTDSMATAYSNTVSVDTGSVSMTPHTVDVSELWDNGYDNVSAPRQSSFSRFVFTTDAASITVSGTTTIYGIFPQYAQLGLRVDGVDLSPLEFTANDSETFSVALGTAGTTRTVEITSGLESKPSSTVLGTFIDSVSYESTGSFNVQTPTVGSRVLVYGDSISVGGNSTNPETQGYFSLLRNTYNYRMMNEGYGYRSLNDDASTSGARSAFVSRVAGYTPSTIWMAIGTNDYGINKWTPANFGTAYAATLDDLHTALPSARIFCQTPVVRTSEVANGLGYTLGEYRDQITTVCNARAWTTLVDGSSILATSDLADGVHPSTAGHTKYANKVAPYLANPSYTVSGPSSGLTNVASTAFTASIASGTFTGGQTVTLSTANGTFTATSAGGSISGNGTSTVIVTPANTATSFTFTYTPTTTGSKSLVFTNGQNWSNPTSATYTVSDSNTAPSTPSSLGAAGYVDGSWSTDSTPTLAFTLADTDGADTVKYKIQVDDSSDFGSPVVDYTSALTSQGSKSFTVGQAEGGGTYTTGSASTILSDTSYYWRVKAIDEYDSESSYATANSGSIAFKIDTSAPTISVVTPATTPTNDSTPNYIFTTNEAGTISYGGSCSSGTTSATLGSNSITFSTLSDGTYTDCTVTVTDAATNASNTLSVASFTVDTTAPTATLSPLDNASGVSPTANLVLSFTETVTVNTGNITIKKTSDDTTVETIDVTGGQVTGTGTAIITINPGVTLLDLTEYYVQIPNTAFRDQVLTAYGGISSTTGWSFTTGDSTAPTITNVSSDKANGVYKAGEVIDIDVTFSEAVTSTGNVTVTLETGTTDRTCTFMVSTDTSGTCNYTVQVGDTSSDLTTNSISGTIEDASGNAMTDFTPATNLAANKALVIDTTAPTISVATPVPTLTSDSTPNYVFTTNEGGSISYGGSCSSATISATSGSNTVTFNALSDGTYTNCTVTVIDTATNASNVLTVASFTVDTTAPTATLSPVDNATSVTSTTNLVLIFSEAVTVNSGTVTIKKTSDNSTVEAIDVTSGQITGSGTSTITVDPSATLQDQVEYYVLVSSTAFRDHVLLSYAGISSTTAWSFTVTDSTAPTIVSISSGKANGSYKAGEVIDIDVTFSEAVTSTGNVTITLETGATDRTCTFTVTSATTSMCDYTVQAGDTSADLTVNSVAGTIADNSSNPMTNFTPGTNLAAIKALVIDTTTPTTPDTPTTSSATSSPTPAWSWGASSDSGSGVATYLVQWSQDSGFSTGTNTSATSANSFTHALELTDGTWYFRVRATDAAGNDSGYSSPGYITISLPVAATSPETKKTKAGPSVAPEIASTQPGSAQDAGTKIILNDFSDFTSGNGYQLDMTALQEIHFTTKSELHSVKVTEIGANYVVFLIQSDPITARLSLGTSGKYDVDKDGKKDISIELISLANGVARLEFAQIKDTASDGGAQVSKAKQSGYVPLIIKATVTGIIIVLIGYRFKSKQSKKEL